MTRLTLQEKQMMLRSALLLVAPVITWMVMSFVDENDDYKNIRQAALD